MNLPQTRRPYHVLDRITQKHKNG